MRCGGRWLLGIYGVLASASLGGCAGESALNPAGPQAQRISDQWWFFFSVAVIVYVVVMAFMLTAIARRRAAHDSGKPDITLDEAREGRMRRVIVIGLTLTVMILFAFLVADFYTGRALSATPKNPLRIKVIGHQWWWEVTYLDIPWEPHGGQPHGIMSTANEIHVPVGTPVLVELESRDVIHSFWVPQLQGKRDLIPGQAASTWLVADKPGSYLGRCAEYCGEQHANMQLVVVAEPKDTFKAWLEGQRNASPNTSETNPSRGQQIFEGSSCILCHTVQGTAARGRVGPDLSHVASRWAIAGGTLPNNRESLLQWIPDPQRIKPGTKMPQNNVPPEDLRVLADWLETLK